MDDITVRYEPFKEVAIMECTRFATPDDLARFANIAAGGKTTGIYWADGVVFVYYPLPTSTEAAAKSVIEDKRVYWAFASYAEMPEYRPLIETKEKIIVPVINMSTSPLFQAVAKWLKQRK